MVLTPFATGDEAQSSRMVAKRTAHAIGVLLVVTCVAVSGPRGLTAATGCGTDIGKGCAPDHQRVDLRRPTFSNPTAITNPLFPISRLHSVVLLGHVNRKPFRTETTLLPGTETVTWEGQQVPVLVSQYVAFLDGRIEEVALDRYAQADDGSVWYFGEDVFDYRNGAIALTEGTWLAGRDGPPAMIMPVDPNVGDVYRTENVPGVVFEEVTVASVDRTVDGPTGPVRGALVAKELHSDGTTERKTFAPGYGEFRTAGSGDLEALALAVPTDALPQPEPETLAALLTAAGGTLESSRLRDWAAATSAAERANQAWPTLRDGQPRMVVARLDRALGAVARALKARNAAAATQAAIDVKQSALDVALRYRPVVAVDAARLDLWTQQLRVHALARDVGGVTGAVATLEWIRDRITGSLDPAGLVELDARLRAQRNATDAGNLRAAADHAARLGACARDLSARAQASGSSS
jgi:hypothetical protein